MISAPTYPTLAIAAPNFIASGSGTTVSVAAGGAGALTLLLGGGHGRRVSVSTSGAGARAALHDTVLYTCHDVYYGWIAPVYASVSVAASVPPETDFAASYRHGRARRYLGFYADVPAG